MSFEPIAEEERKRAVTGLVDGSLPSAERERTEALAGRSPELRLEVERQRRVVQALSAGGPEVPDALLTTIEEQVRLAHQPRRRPIAGPGSSLASRSRPAVALIAVAVAAVVIVAVVLAASGTAKPSVTAAAELAFKPATGPAPAAASATHLDISYAGITYPNYNHQFAATPTGKRLDAIAGRQALTVFYRLRDGSRLSYTVFSGPPVSRPAAARGVTFAGVPLHVYKTRSGLSVVTLVRFGRTCVLAAPTGPIVVLALAAAPVRAQAA